MRQQYIKMKSKFSKSWVSSKQPRKQRKFLANAPRHIKQKLMSSPLDKPLREKYQTRNIEIRKNDEVRVMRGKFTKKQGKVTLVDVNNQRVQIDGLNITKKDGEKVPVWFHPSKIKIIKLEDSDKKRFKQLNKKVPSQEKTKDKDSIKTKDNKEVKK